MNTSLSNDSTPEVALSLLSELSGEVSPGLSDAGAGTIEGRPPRLTDSGNAEFFALVHKPKIRYCHSSARWLLWDERRWRPDDSEKIVALARATAKSMYRHAANTFDIEKSKALVAHILRTESESRLHAMISMAKSDPNLAVTASDLDADQYLLNCLNGTVELKTGLLRPHRRDDLITKMAPVEYDPNAKCPVFEQFLKKIMAGNEDLIRYLRRIIGYALTGSVIEEAIFFLIGKGANGKTTLLETIRTMLGDYAGQIPIETLMKKKSDGGIPNDIAMLHGLRFVTSSETEQGQTLAASKIKYLTGNGMILARYLHHEFFQFSPTHKTFMDANHKPVVRGDDDAIWRRLKNIPFSVVVPSEERDPDLLEKLRRELSGVLAWAVQGCLDWQQNGLSEASAVTAATRAYRQEMDTPTIFLDDCCAFGPMFRETTSALYTAYQEWCKDSGDTPETVKSFAATLAAREGLTAARSSKSRYWRGVHLKAETAGD